MSPIEACNWKSNTHLLKDLSEVFLSSFIVTALNKKHFKANGMEKHESCFSQTIDLMQIVLAKYL